MGDVYCKGNLPPMQLPARTGLDGRERVLRAHLAVAVAEHARERDQAAGHVPVGRERDGEVGRLELVQDSAGLA